MNRSILLLVITTLIYCDYLYAQLGCSGGRYLNEIFPTVTTTSNILYGNNTNLSGSPEDLFLDVYEPAGDTVSMRPLIILAHGGSFTSGDKADGCIVDMCKNFTKLGYVTASIDYRLGMACIPCCFCCPDSVDATESVMRAFHDAKAAVRFFRKDFVLSGNTYRIDTSLIFFGGQSAGAFMAIQLAYLDEVSEIPSYIDTTKAGLGGGVEGNSGNPGYSSKVKAIINISGAIGDTAWMKTGDTPMISFHGDQDGTVPYATDWIGVLFCNNIIIVDGSSTMNLKANAIGIDNCFKPYWGAGHVPECGNAAYMDSTVTYTKHFLLQFVCNSPSICSYILPACAASFAGFTVITSNLTANFTDNSSSTGITSWSWDFDDGSPVDNTQNPTHTYGADGIYVVCLIVTDSCGADTICQDVTLTNVGVTPGYPGLTLGSVKLFPTPAVNELNIVTTLPQQVIFNIYNVIGLQIKSVIINGTKKISTAELYTGMYIYQIADRNGVVLSRGKFNVVK
ncbi:MAG: PKD domain-containing protein [Cytophagales bacterium]|nr:PKD domain-containing protein [Cytophagales bacterium]